MELLIWSFFLVFVLSLLIFDLYILHDETKPVSVQRSIRYTLFYISISLLFTIPVYLFYSKGWIGHLTGGEAASQYLAGYLMEQALSLDNILVISLIFKALHIPQSLQHRVLFLGIVGVLVMRFVMIFAGLTLFHRFVWITYVFGLILIYSAYHMLKNQESSVAPSNHPLYKKGMEKGWITAQYEKDHFFIKQDGKWVGTPLFVALIFVESADLLFALDSIPAVFAVTTDTFLVFSSNIFAIMGLRSLYFVLAHMIEKFHYLKHSLAILLAFVGFKMLFAHFIYIPTALSLFIIIAVLVGGTCFSWVYRKQ